MQDLSTGANYFFFWGGGLETRGVAMRLLEGFGACFPRIFLEWSKLVRFGAYFHKFFTFKKSKNRSFLYKNNYKL